MVLKTENFGCEMSMHKIKPEAKILFQNISKLTIIRYEYEPETYQQLGRRYSLSECGLNFSKVTILELRRYHLEWGSTVSDQTFKPFTNLKQLILMVIIYSVSFDLKKI